MTDATTYEAVGNAVEAAEVSQPPDLYSIFKELYMAYNGQKELVGEFVVRRLEEDVSAYLQEGTVPDYLVRDVHRLKRN